MNEMVSELPGLTFSKENLPSKSVIVPLVVPATTTDAPITGSPVASFTTPVQVVDYWVTSITSGSRTGAAYIPEEVKPAVSNNRETDLKRFNIVA